MHRLVFSIRDFIVPSELILPPTEDEYDLLREMSLTELRSTALAAAEAAGLVTPPSVDRASRTSKRLRPKTSFKAVKNPRLSTPSDQSAPNIGVPPTDTVSSDPTFSSGSPASAAATSPSSPAIITHPVGVITPSATAATTGSDSDNAQKELKAVDLTPYLHLSQYEVARLLGTTQSTLSKKWKMAMGGKVWPRRKMRKLQSKMDTLNTAIAMTSQEDFPELRSALSKLEKEQAALSRDGCIVKLWCEKQQS